MSAAMGKKEKEYGNTATLAEFRMRAERTRQGYLEDAHKGLASSIERLAFASSAVDDSLQREILELMDQLVALAGKVVDLVTHEVWRLCKECGQITPDSWWQEFIDSPHEDGEEYIPAKLGDMPTLLVCPSCKENHYRSFLDGLFAGSYSLCQEERDALKNAGDPEVLLGWARRMTDSMGRVR